MLEEVRASEKGVQWAVGWARDPATPDKSVAVDLFADDVLLTTGYATRHHEYRPGEAAPCGFKVSLPPNFACGETVRLVAKARSANGNVEIGRLEVRRPPFGHSVTVRRPEHAPAPHVPASFLAERSRAAIILTRDGATVLAALLESMLQFEPHAFRRIIVVDHASVDDTEAVLARYAQLLPIEVMARPRTGSFSESNNAATERCDEDLIFFLNNDIVFTSAIVDRMASHLGEGIGLVGLRLMDPPAQSEPPLQAPQHVGVHFWPTPIGIRPIESRTLTDFPAANRMAIETPAVTAALLATSRPVFRRLGGFCEGFYFGLEDTELCVRSLAAGYRNVCVNDADAIHVGSHTRAKMAPALEERASENRQLLNTRCGYYLRRSLAAEQFERPGYWTGRNVHVGLVVSDRDGEGSRRAAEILARAMSPHLPIKAFVYDSGQPVDASDLDIVVVLDPRFNVRRLARLGTTAWLAAWMQSEMGEWDQAPWREQFDLWFSGAPGTEAAKLRTVRSVTVLPGPGGALDRARGAEGDGDTADLCGRLFLARLRAQAAGGLRVTLSAGALSGYGPAPQTDARLVQLRHELESCGHIVRIRLPGEPKRLTNRDDALILAIGDAAMTTRNFPQIRILMGAVSPESVIAPKVAAFDRIFADTEAAAVAIRASTRSPVGVLPPDSAAGIGRLAEMLDSLLRQLDREKRDLDRLSRK